MHQLFHHLLLATSLVAIASGNVIRGVNLGGWLLVEQWMTPSLFYDTTAADEWHLCNQLGKEACLGLLQDHWSTFYTRDDLVAIQAAGLNAVRIPIGYWAVDLLDYEPYVSGQFPYLIQAVNWAQELGLTVLIDLHGAPGSQNGQDNSGLIGPVLFATNSSNIDRSLNVIRNLTQEFSQSQYGGVVTSIELLNEPRLGNTFNMSQLKSFYSGGMSNMTSVSHGQMNMTIHDAFWGPQYWAGYDPSSSGESSIPTVIDTHQYYAFPPLGNLTHHAILQSICNISYLLKSTDLNLLPTVVGEWSLESGNPPNTSSSDQNDGDDTAKRTWLRLMFEAQLAAYEPNGPGQPSLGWYFWSWKQEWDIDTWSYRMGIGDGWIPSDVSNMSQRVYPLLSNGCVDAGFNYTAPPLSSGSSSGGGNGGGGYGGYPPYYYGSSPAKSAPFLLSFLLVMLTLYLTL
ncbi:glycoside hydrolase superfamily [Kockovaella imperatae]|uniref:Glycoside hydrolase superfamily n=1 Tax=Kockovaella imperatae TaxID=4999 RepID=A0A1Y1UIV7_9TREE|nr:glycoside hydrolase superfamily [Kockovaella imperatae]ORX37909.1 glycoside hydrolase superfamily [Kockovaella imperatae]